MARRTPVHSFPVRRPADPAVSRRRLVTAFRLLRLAMLWLVAAVAISSAVEAFILAQDMVRFVNDYAEYDYARYMVRYLIATCVLCCFLLAAAWREAK